MWSLGCIAAELVSGELLFPTHDDAEHLVMIEKNSGRVPQWMINKTASSSLRRLFRDGSICECEAERQLSHMENVRGMRRSDELLGN